MNSKNKKTQKCDLVDVEMDIDAVIQKNRSPDIHPDTTVIAEPKDPPEYGFFIVMISKRGKEITFRQFGRDMELFTIEKGFLKILNSLYPPNRDERIGIA